MASDSFQIGGFTNHISGEGVELIHRIQLEFVAGRARVQITGAGTDNVVVLRPEHPAVLQYLAELNQALHDTRFS